MKAFNRYLVRVSELVCAALLALMFVVFVIQIVVRYTPLSGFDWTLEFCLVLWLWLVFLGSPLLFSHEEFVRFDLFYRRVSAKARRWLTMLSAVAIVVGLGVAFWPTWKYISFLTIKPSASLPFSMGGIYSIYLFFTLALIFRYLLMIVQLWRRPPADGEGQGGEDR